MRENIGLFRGKRIDTGEWVEGNLAAYDLICPEYPEDTSNATGEYYGQTPYVGFVEVIPDTVGECTGLRDKNGKLIFEHDVIRFGDRIGSIVYGEGCWCVRDFTTRNRPAIDIILCEFDVEIIGNIHDNGELLKGGEQ